MPSASPRHMSPDTWLLIAFVTTCFLLGGGSRADTASLILLRPLAALFLTIAILRAPAWWLEFRWPVVFALAATMLIALQLVPLPPAAWTSLPGRSPLVDVANATGVPLGWRPISMQPVRTWNALFSMLVPLAALLLTASAGFRGSQRLLPVIVGLGAASTLLGLLQVIGPATGPLYLYRNTGDGYANGLFANRNHHAALIGCLFPLLAVLARTSHHHAGRAAAMRLILAAFALFLMALLLLTGSRAGLLLGGMGIVGGGWLYVRSADPRPSRQSRSPWRRRMPLLAAVGAVVLLIAISIAVARAPSIDRLFGAGMEGGRRLAVYPTVLRMIPEYIPFGSGFGTFAEVFQINEPDTILGPTYLNQAHNDWLQIVIEGGWPAALLALAGLALLIRVAAGVLRRDMRTGMTPLLGRAGIIILLILGTASLVDYPVRTPSLAMLATIAFCWMFAAARSGRAAADQG